MIQANPYDKTDKITATEMPAKKLSDLVNVTNKTKAKITPATLMTLAIRSKPSFIFIIIFKKG